MAALTNMVIDSPACDQKLEVPITARLRTARVRPALTGTRSVAMDLTFDPAPIQEHAERHLVEGT